MCDKEKVMTEFESRLIWNDDKMGCFLPEDFSCAYISELPPYIDIDILLKSGKSIRYVRYSWSSPEMERAKTRLQELMKEIGEKLNIKKPLYMMDDGRII